MRFWGQEGNLWINGIFFSPIQNNKIHYLLIYFSLCLFTMSICYKSTKQKLGFSLKNRRYDITNTQMPNSWMLGYDIPSEYFCKEMHFSWITQLLIKYRFACHHDESGYCTQKIQIHERLNQCFRSVKVIDI